MCLIDTEDGGAADGGGGGNEVILPCFSKETFAHASMGGELLLW